jgi:hypothetical protein
VFFLLEYDRSRGELASIKAFNESERNAAENERLAKELSLHRSGISREVVLLEAGSEEALKETHRRYFADIATLAKTEWWLAPTSSSSPHRR